MSKAPASFDFRQFCAALINFPAKNRFLFDFNVTKQLFLFRDFIFDPKKMPEQGGADRFSSDLDEIRIVIRSILTTFKQGCPVDTLLREYYETCGDRLPFRKLGYKSAEDLLRDLPDVAYFQT